MASVLPREYGYVVATAVVSGFVVNWMGKKVVRVGVGWAPLALTALTRQLACVQGIQVGRARKKYGISCKCFPSALLTWLSGVQIWLSAVSRTLPTLYHPLLIPVAHRPEDVCPRRGLQRSQGR